MLLWKIKQLKKSNKVLNSPVFIRNEFFKNIKCVLCVYKIIDSFPIP